ncbi:glycogen/starch synthase [Glaciimonas sp. PCH181]|uniref:glycogen/starch synthase n=1 Tax=Glaciimonas sp. PCH181 TaxID=2133943 RepID=UPI000D3D988E|nr:glycogen/starch synthase [Glaciimonas sp. PCH181]PUA20301.1 hypothetical protein C7W93_11180 [Glaciimonas sp. PCH181]
MRARVLLVTSEAIPLAKTGGLADVITALTDTLRKQGVDASILMPGYPSALQIAQNRNAYCEWLLSISISIKKKRKRFVGVGCQD